MFHGSIRYSLVARHSGAAPRARGASPCRPPRVRRLSIPTPRASMDGFGMEGLSHPTETSSAQWELELTARDIYARAVRAAPRRSPRRAATPAIPPRGRPTSRSSSATPTSPTPPQVPAPPQRRGRRPRRLRNWLCYWIVHALALLGESLPPDLADDVVEFLALCQHPDGGFGGGPGQMPHLAPTYAATACLAEIATPRAFAVVDRVAMLRFLRACHDDAGGYRMHTRRRDGYARVLHSARRRPSHRSHGRGSPRGSAQIRHQVPDARGRRRRRPERGSLEEYTFCGARAAGLVRSRGRVGPPRARALAGAQTGCRGGGFMELGRVRSSTDVTPSVAGGRVSARRHHARTRSFAPCHPPRGRMSGTGTGTRMETGMTAETETETGTATAGTDGDRFPRLSGVPACSLFPLGGGGGECGRFGFRFVVGSDDASVLLARAPGMAPAVLPAPQRRFTG